MPNILKELDRHEAKAKAAADAAEAATTAAINARKDARQADIERRTKERALRKSAARTIAEKLVEATLSDEESRVLFGFVERTVIDEKERQVMIRAGFLHAPKPPASYAK